jgi:hypothetical protein
LFSQNSLEILGFIGVYWQFIFKFSSCNFYKS